jgi:hypothetical protein
VNDVEKFHSILDSIPLLPDTTLCAEFNARLGHITGDTDTNSRALTSFIEDRQLHLWQTPAIHGIPTFCTFREERVHQSIVDLFLSNFQADVTEMTVRTDLSLSSDHRLITASAKLPDPPVDAPRPPGRRNVEPVPITRRGSL